MNTLPSKSTATHHWKIVMITNPYMYDFDYMKRIGIHIPKYSLMVGKKSEYGIEYDTYDRNDDIHALVKLMEEKAAE